ncbi:MAG TPA: hypothetical protein VM364_05610 [Vicinamibacterales bacterium]|nr:hypothetical protein [Vicinamibacterales bacterium]
MLVAEQDAPPRCHDDSHVVRWSRNHKVEEALAAATGPHDYAVMHRLLEVLSRPYDHDRDLPEFTAPPPSPGGYRTFCGT